MSILAVYEDSDLHQPSKVLTHLEDIAPLLADLGVRLEALSVAELAGVTLDADLLEVGARLCAKSLAGFDMPYRQIVDLPSVPAYAAITDDEIEPEHSHSQAGFRLLVQGRATLCLYQGSRLLALACAPGDLLFLPAELLHWAIPVPGEPCRVVQFSTTAGDLQAIPGGSGLAKGFLPLE